MSKVRMETSKGDVVIELFEDKAPATVKNFLQYVDEKFYDGTIFHRVIDGFMCQGGGFDEKMQKKDTRTPIRNEAGNGIKNTKGTVAMARTSAPDSATAQFFLNVADNAFLDFKDSSARGIGYCVFGKVIEGEGIVDKIRVVRTGHKNGMDDVPVETVKILSIRRAD